MSCSCTRRAPIPRCPTRATPSRAGSSAARPSPPSTRRSLCEQAATCAGGPFTVRGARGTVAPMFKFRSKATPRQDETRSATSLAEPPRLTEATESELLAELAQLSASNRQERSTETEKRMLAIRNAIGVQRLLVQAPADDHPEPDFDALPAGQLPEVTRDQLTPALVRAGILRHGCLLVRGLVPRADAVHFAQEIDRLFDERHRHDER